MGEFTILNLSFRMIELSMPARQKIGGWGVGWISSKEDGAGNSRACHGPNLE